MEWERDGKGWQLQDAEDHYEIIPARIHNTQKFVVWKNDSIWLATTETFSSADRAVASEIAKPEFYSARPSCLQQNMARQRQRELARLEVKRKEVNDSVKRRKTVKLYRW